VQCSTNEHYCIADEANGYSSAPSTFVKQSKSRSTGEPIFCWGRAVVNMLDKKSSRNFYRLIRLRFAIAFGQKFLPQSTALTPAHMVSQLAEFEIIFDPSSRRWLFGK
jgi:hypothetical protein